MSCFTKKPVFGNLQPGNSNRPVQLQKLTSLEILDTATIGIILSRQQTTKVIIRLGECAGCYATNRFSHVMAHIKDEH